jgi:hypothetical protein
MPGGLASENILSLIHGYVIPIAMLFFIKPRWCRNPNNQLVLIERTHVRSPFKAITVEIKGVARISFGECFVFVVRID